MLAKTNCFICILFPTNTIVNRKSNICSFSDLQNGNLKKLYSGSSLNFSAPGISDYWLLLIRINNVAGFVCKNANRFIIPSGFENLADGGRAGSFYAGPVSVSGDNVTIDWVVNIRSTDGNTSERNVSLIEIYGVI